MDTGHATGIDAPQLWGYGRTYDFTRGLFSLEIIERRAARPVALFAGDLDIVTPTEDISDSRREIRLRNNLDRVHTLLDPFSDTQMDDATTQRRTYALQSDDCQPYSVYREFLVQGSVGFGFISGSHAMPDAEECDRVVYMTCDYSYTTQTKLFFEQHADLNLNP